MIIDGNYRELEVTEQFHRGSQSRRRHGNCKESAVTHMAFQELVLNYMRLLLIEKTRSLSELKGHTAANESETPRDILRKEREVVSGNVYD